MVAGRETATVRAASRQGSPADDHYCAHQEHGNGTTVKFSTSGYDPAAPGKVTSKNTEVSAYAGIENGNVGEISFRPYGPLAVRPVKFRP
jgi:hypothetical protein